MTSYEWLDLLHDFQRACFVWRQPDACSKEEREQWRPFWEQAALRDPGSSVGDALKRGVAHAERGFKNAYARETDQILRARLLRKT